MKICFFLDNRGVRNADYSRPWEGSPGIGAASFMQVAIPYFIKKFGGRAVEAWVFAPYTDFLPDTIPYRNTESITDAARKAKEMEFDYFIYRSRIQEEDKILDVVDELELSAIGIAVLSPNATHIRRLSKSKSFKALVCVGREQYDYLMDSPLYKKLAYIDLGVDVVNCNTGSNQVPDKDERLVTYMGALVPQKGFHVLSEAWPKVLERFPDARLSVIGSAKIYNENSKLGPLGIADEQYEKNHIIPYLTQPDGTLHPSVTLHGRLEREKYDILQRTLIGVVNPTGQTETCCVSAVEMAACRTAVVTGAYYALLDTVHHKKTGLLGRGVDQLVENICTLLENPDYAIDLGNAGHKRTLKQYDFSVVAKRWNELFENLSNQHIPKPTSQLKNIFYHFKLLRIINRFFQMTIGSIVLWPSVQEAEQLAHKVRKVLRGLKSS